MGKEEDEIVGCLQTFFKFFRVQRYAKVGLKHLKQRSLSYKKVYHKRRTLFEVLEKRFPLILQTNANSELLRNFYKEINHRLVRLLGFKKMGS